MLQRHDQRVEAQPRPQVCCHAPADDLASGQVLDGGEVQEAFLGRDIADVGETDGIRAVGRELAAKPVGGDR